MNALQSLGLNKKKKADFEQTLFYFFREFKVNPFDEEWVIDGKKVVKRGMPIPLFNSLMEQMSKHYEREAAQYNKVRR